MFPQQHKLYNSRIRTAQKYGEDNNKSNLIEELKKQKETKLNTSIARKQEQYSHQKKN